MGKKDNVKSQEKKAERKAMAAKRNTRVANVKLANSAEDPLAVLPKPFSVYNKNGLDLKLETTRAPEVDEKTLVWAFNMVESSMKPLYDASHSDDPDGWNGKEKKIEMREVENWYLIARNPEGTAVAFATFRYDMEYDDEVIYCYEIQVEKSFRRKGLGRFMMKLLEMLAIKADMLKLMVTIFKNDKPQVDFFKTALKFSKDETNLGDTSEEQFEYEILCRYNMIKKKKIEEEEGVGEKNVPDCCKVGDKPLSVKDALMRGGGG